MPRCDSLQFSLQQPSLTACLCALCALLVYSVFLLELTLGCVSVMLFSEAASVFIGVVGTVPLGSVISRLRLSRVGRGSVLVTRNLKLKSISYVCCSVHHRLNIDFCLLATHTFSAQTSIQKINEINWEINLNLLTNTRGLG